jgi:hypothetical protein
MKTFLKISKTTGIGLLIISGIGALLTLAFGLWPPVTGFTVNFFDAEYDAQALAVTGFFEWMALFFGTAIAYFIAIIVGFAAIVFAGSVVALTLLFVALSLIAGALALISPILIVAGLVWFCVWAVRRLSKKNAGAVA